MSKQINGKDRNFCRFYMIFNCFYTKDLRHDGETTLLPIYMVGVI